MICRSKIAKIISIKIEDSRRGGRLENLFFASPPEPKKPIDLKLGRKHRGDLLIKTNINRYERKSKIAAVVVILKIFVFASTPEPKGQLKLGRKHQGDL